MALITKQAFALKCNIPTNQLSVLLKRGQVVCDGDMADTNHPKNVLYYNNREAKGLLTKKESSKKSAPKKPKSDKLKTELTDDEDDLDDDGLMDMPAGKILPLDQSERRKKHFEAINAERNSELLRMRKEKLQGIVIPSAPLVPVILQHNQHILMEQKNADEEILSMLAHRYDITPADVAYMRGEWVTRRNAAATKAADATKKSIKSIINDYSEKRGVGERA